MEFSQIEWEIIEHRLSASDAIAEVLNDEYGLDLEEVNDRVLTISKSGCKEIDMSSSLDRMIIEDCCSGSTFFANLSDAVATDELSHQKVSAYHRAADRISDKVGTPVTRY